MISKVVRSRRRSLALQINPDGALVVRAPMRLGEKEILGFISKKKDWILKKQQAAAGRGKVCRQYVSGEEFCYLGKNYKLRISGLDEGLGLIGDEFVLGHKNAAGARGHFWTWYVAKARQVLAERVNHWAGICKLVVRQLKIKDAKTRWGSCGPNGVMHLSWRLVMAPMWVIDYVVVHELMHIAVANHSAKFWGRVGEFIPYYKEARKWLRENGQKLVL